MVSRLFVIATLCFLVLILSCARHMPEKHIKVAHPEFDLVIASDQSDFKAEIRSRIIERYRGRGNIRVVDAGSVGGIKCEAHDAIVVIDTCKAWMWFDFSLKSFLRRSRNCNNVVLYLTAGDPDWTYQYKGLDAVTSASDVGSLNAALDQLTAQIDRLITPHSEIKKSDP